MRIPSTDRPGAVRLAVIIIFSAALALGFSGDKSLQKHYGLIFGTAYGPDDRPLYGAKIEIHPAGKKHPNWELMSDHRGEFAQRVPPGPQDYIVEGEAEVALMVDGVARDKKKKLKAEKSVHIEAEERQDIGLHFQQ